MRVCLVFLAAMVAAAGLAPPASAEPGTPSTVPNEAKNVQPRASAPGAAGGSLSPFYTESGKLRLSVDGLGTNNPAGGVIQVQKPSGATVRRAFLAAASTGGTRYSPVDGDVILDGSPVKWDNSKTISNSVVSVNVLADVTSLVKEKLDVAPAGLVDFTVSERETLLIDGEILAVVFDDPSLSGQNTVLLLYGAQDVLGDSFHVLLAEPIDKSDSDLALTLGLGISWGYQVLAGQFSVIDVNGQRVSTSAGGQDDGEGEDGALLTVGGLGDSTANPVDPFADDETCTNPPAPRCDDELYDLLPFVQNGDTAIDIHTADPSRSDNIFFGALQFGSVVATVGEGIVLVPTSATNQVGTTHTLRATVQDASGNPLSGKVVAFKVMAGPNLGTTLRATTNATGQAQVSYSSATTGTDHIVASFVDSQGDTQTSNEATKDWIANSGNCTITGTAGDDVLAGTPGEDVICGLEGNDRLSGLGGNDRLLGGPGNDRLFGGYGDDSIDGGAGNDRGRGGHGDDALVGGAGDDSMDGEAGNDRLFGGHGDDTMVGGAGNDRLFGGHGDDAMNGEAGNDRLRGGPGDDTMDGGAGDDRLRGGRGDDTLNGGVADDRCDGGDDVDTATTCEELISIP